jgi:hypothetical protein
MVVLRYLVCSSLALVEVVLGGEATAVGGGNIPNGLSNEILSYSMLDKLSM